MTQWHAAPVRAKDQVVRAGLLPARAQLLVAILRAAEHETVAQQILERLLKRVFSGQDFVLSPLSIGLVFLRKIGARHFERGRPVLGAIDLARVGQHARKRFAEPRQFGAIQTQLAGDLGNCRVRIDEPAVAVIAFCYMLPGRLAEIHRVIVSAESAFFPC